MKIRFLGTSHGAAEKDAKCTSVILETNGFFYIIDTGTCVNEYMMANGLDTTKIRGIFITHMHEDHVGKISSLLKLMTTYKTSVRATYVFPEDEAPDGVEAWLKLLHSRPLDHNRLPFLVAKSGEVVYSDENLKVTAIKTDHIANADTYGYLFECEGKRIMFTGDLTPDLHDYPEIISTEGVDVVVTELCHYFKTSYFVEGSIEKLRSSKTGRIIFSHKYPGGPEAMLSIADTFSFPIDVANDNDIFEI